MEKELLHFMFAWAIHEIRVSRARALVLASDSRCFSAMRSFLDLVLLILVAVFILIRPTTSGARRREDKTKCPKVKAARNFDVAQFLGEWFVVQYYASSEEAISYRCMRAELSLLSPEQVSQHKNPGVTMNFTYSFSDDPINEQLVGNITWSIPLAEMPAHWLHAEQPYEGVYNTYVLDSDYKSWALLLHCAEKSKSPRYLSSFIMSREPSIGNNVISYLREKLPRYDVDLEYMFPMDQENCTTIDPYESQFVPPAILAAKKTYFAQRRHPLKRKHRRA
ncbi:hypothetical protein QAD02_017936 [Eretmocerus hayati]|uniref:Uncharacterized protein n=1 Tax=Eretmocerus hayati TaxID=131215 RepID=A0ACC2PHT0_9HYME|nr:hypothetical protein QAD02_017936 [Eretmocerus hayati]